MTREKIAEEMKKALLDEDKPSVFFEELRETDRLSEWFPELEALIGVEQDPVFHPEGDVWTHTMEVIDRAAEYRDKVSDPLAFMLLALTHDMGKAVTTSFVKGRIHAYEHELWGVPIAEKFLSRLKSGKAVTDYVLNMLPLHMRPNVAAYNKPSLKSTNHMFDVAAAPEDLIYFASADRPVFSGTDSFSGDSRFLFERLDAYHETMARPYVMESDLAEAGLGQGEEYGELLEYAHKLRLAGIDKESALKQVLAQARRKRRQ